MVVRMRLNRSQRDSRRSHHRYAGESALRCPECGAQKMPHRMCDNCGTYKGKVVVDVHAQIARREERKSAKHSARDDAADETEKKAEEKKEA